MEPKNKDKKGVSFKDTLNLPTTDFPIRANAAVEDPKMIERWGSEHIYEKTFFCYKGSEKFILHDGPPYANGNIHLGTAFNKVRKDMLAKAQRMLGKQVPVQPGWDCHGLPIELNVTKKHPNAKPQELRKECRAFARHWIDVQREEFKQLAVFMDWEHPYLTMDYSYESSILEAFSVFVKKNYIERKNKTVPWCASCQTVLAISEIEYYDRKDPSIYVTFPLPATAVKEILPELAEKSVSLSVWTTTPWTLPLNRAVLVRPDATYSVLQTDKGYLIVGKQLADELCSVLEITKKVVAELDAEKLAAGHKAQHPFVPKLQVPILLDPLVSTEEGTALVHCAPGCGPQDYEFGVRNNLEIFSPISASGHYTKGIVPHELEGMLVADGQIWVLKKLDELGMLLAKKNITHSYPHCWRCRNGLIFRATKQLFCDLSKHNLRDRVLRAIDDIHMLPENSKNRLRAALEGRLEWCLSRQRIWGVPIPALLCDHCDYAYCPHELVRYVAKGVAQHGIEYWDDISITKLISENLICPGCKSSKWRKEQDTLDVWFGSGVSHYAVLDKNPELAFPADVYLEGKDQHRGWFQSSLLTSMVIEEEACMKSILTHGYTVDERGHKMSKSLGNVVLPHDLAAKIGVDGLRLWASTIDYSSEAILSDVLVRNVQEVHRKIRNTARFLLSNLYDFDIDRDAVGADQMRIIDQYAMQQLFEQSVRILDAYNRYDFTAVFHELANYCSVDLSSFYLDIVKDRLYVEAADGTLRRSAQTTCWYILDTLTRLIAPILSITAEQLSDHYQKNKKESIHLQKFAPLRSVWDISGKQKVVNPVDFIPKTNRPKVDDVLAEINRIPFMMQYHAQWDLLKDLRDALLKAIEQKREVGMIKHPLEARLAIYFDFDKERRELLDAFFKMLEKTGQTPSAFFKEFLIVSQVTIADKPDNLTESSMPGLWVAVEHAAGTKCPRCWQWEKTTHEHGLCERCQRIVK